MLAAHTAVGPLCLVLRACQGCWLLSVHRGTGGGGGCFLSVLFPLPCTPLFGLHSQLSSFSAHGHLSPLPPGLVTLELVLGCVGPKQGSLPSLPPEACAELLLPSRHCESEARLSGRLLFPSSSVLQGPPGGSGGHLTGTPRPSLPASMGTQHSLTSCSNLLP